MKGWADVETISTRAAAASARPSRAHVVERAVLSFPPQGLGDAPAAGVSALWQALKRSVPDMIVALRAAGAPPAASTPDLEATADILCAAVRQVVRGREPLLPDFPTTVPADRCLDALRRAFVARARALRDEADRDALLDILEAVDQVQTRLEAQTAQRLACGLSGRTGAELLAEVAHDMRSPLGSILFLVETLRKGQSGPLNAVQERQLAIAYNAAFGLSAMASDLTELARGCHRLLDHHPAPFSVAEVMRNVGAILQPMAEEKGLALELSPPAACYRSGHAAALQRVLLNLATNALKFTNDGSVEVSARQRGRSQMEFAVTDSGRGIPPEVVATLFDTFRTLPNGRHVFSCAGLGLSICRNLVAAMGGELRVEPGARGGTRFHFTVDLPAVRTI